ncbi:hypothetical protein GCM10010923_07520 [Blastomonas marina]|uniref:DUF2157 domain-containing protein n=1 Tax=Blastomonas marina TaxID=1867408 RepID=A0ABQ1F6B3_9SPHN|nr:hypothetical protein [Blastomonas marina]GGA01312.1 hypothetical protein GCM10010923_07520 [Blastomonas marina]
MYSETDLRSAVEAGAISDEAARALRSHVASMKDAVPADAEHFRLITGFNDIFVSIGVVIMLLAAVGIGQAIGGAYDEGTVVRDGLQMLFGGALAAGTAWLLAEFFTRKRRMALPSIILLLAFVLGVAGATLGAAVAAIGPGDGTPDWIGGIIGACVGIVTAGAAWLHWKRFMVPITIAALVAALALTVISLIIAAVQPSEPETFVLALVFVAGLAIFAFAMRWDVSDPRRETRRADVAFWLHLLAAPMLAHPLFSLIGVTDGEATGVGAAIGVLAIYVLFGIVALAVDRRALLVSALAYVLFALTFLFREFGFVELNFALTALIIGSALLSLSAFWSPIRKAVVTKLPSDWRAKLPATELAAA